MINMRILKIIIWMRRVIMRTCQVFICELHHVVKNLLEFVVVCYCDSSLLWLSNLSTFHVKFVQLNLNLTKGYVMTKTIFTKTTFMEVPMKPNLKVLVLPRGVHIVDDIDTDVQRGDPAGEDQFSFRPLKVLSVDGRACDRPPFYLTRRELGQREKDEEGKRGKSRMEPTLEP